LLNFPFHLKNIQIVTFISSFPYCQLIFPLIHLIFSIRFLHFYMNINIKKNREQNKTWACSNDTWLVNIFFPTQSWQTCSNKSFPRLGAIQKNRKKLQSKVANIINKSNKINIIDFIFIICEKSNLIYNNSQFNAKNISPIRCSGRTRQQQLSANANNWQLLTFVKEPNESPLVGWGLGNNSD